MSSVNVPVVQVGATESGPELVRATVAILVDQTGAYVAPGGGGGGGTVIEEPYQGVVPMTPGTAIAAQRALRIVCTAAGNVSFTYIDGSQDTLPINVGVSVIPGAITTVNTSGTTATATYAGLK